MYKTIIILYIVVFFTYVLFSRQPDYFDGEQMPATIHFVKDQNDKSVAKATFNVDKKDYVVNAAYLFRSFTEGEKVNIIYEKEHPEKAAVYSLWGYWLTWQELVGSIVLLIVLFQAAVKITSHPSPESLIDELEDDDRPRKKRRYNS
ncbi:hypothetical protein QTN47_08805 [Danxiaibacter flavus]|uniref:DUF3592 domain-containing protein n=1 Tax=Danxiaibacter flavus TaxID=3049108 RepID=A0ABV3ZGH0_9BACT|nr:hypothetical protein QNM32_08805 [Chitinophagaceae bacterium DXS]